MTDRIRQLVKQQPPSGPAPAGGKPGSAPPPASPNPSPAEANHGFSFLRWDPVLKEMLWDLTLASGTQEHYLVRVGCCDNPGCDCRILDAWLRPVHASSTPPVDTHLRLRFDRRQVEFTLPAGPDSERLAREMGARLNREDWVLAEQIYCSDKADASEPNDVSKLDLPFPDAIRADPTAVIQYRDLFPYARTINLQTEGRSWVVLERYCSNPDCTCTDVFLDLLPAPEVALERRHRVVNDREVAGVNWDYDHERLTVRKEGPAGMPPATNLFQALRDAYPDLNGLLRRHHRILRQLHAKARSQPAQPRANPSRPQPKVGRNDPCPCGSGRKHKKCCGKP